MCLCIRILFSIFVFMFVSQKEKNDDLDYHIMLKLVAMKEVITN